MASKLDADLTEEQSPKADSCAKHIGAALDFVCKSCKKSACALCIVHEHSGHDFECVKTLKKEILELRKNLEIRKRNVMRMKKECQEMLGKVLEITDEKLFSIEQERDRRRSSVELDRNYFEKRVKGITDSLEKEENKMYALEYSADAALSRKMEGSEENLLNTIREDLGKCTNAQLPRVKTYNELKVKLKRMHSANRFSSSSRVTLEELETTSFAAATFHSDDTLTTGPQSVQVIELETPQGSSSEEAQAIEGSSEDESGDADMEGDFEADMDTDTNDCEREGAVGGVVFEKEREGVALKTGTKRQNLEIVASPPPWVPAVSHVARNLKSSTSTPSLQTYTPPMISASEECDFPLPKYQSEGFFDQKGGELMIPSHGLTLSVPPEALPEGVSRMISVSILSDIPPEITLRDDEMVVTHCFQCLPSGLHFAAERSVRLTIPHCANLMDPQKTQAVLYTWHHEGTKERNPERILLTPRTCQVTPHDVKIFLEHFSRGFLAFIIDWWYTSGKRMSFMPFLPREIPPSRSVMLELRMVNKPYGTSWRDVHEFEKNAEHKPAKDDDDEMNVKDEDMTVSCQLNDDTPRERNVCVKLLQKMKHTVYFKLDFEGKANDLPVNLTLKQTCDEMDIAFITRFTEHMVVGRETDEAVDSPLTQDVVTDQKLDKLSNCLPPDKYSEFCSLIGFGFNQADSILESNSKVFSKAVRHCLGGWKNRTGGRSHKLKRILREAELEALIVHIKL